jgi:hypothetical protein
VRDRLAHHHVEGADAIRRYQQQAIHIDFVDIAHLSTPNPRKGKITE